MDGKQTILHIKEEIQDDGGSFPSAELQNATSLFLHCEMCDIQFNTSTEFGTHVAEIHNKTTSNLSESYHTMGLMQDFEIDANHDQLLCVDKANPSGPNHTMVLERNPEINSSYDWLSGLGELSKSDILKVDLGETGHKMEPTTSGEQQKTSIDFDMWKLQNAGTSGGLQKTYLDSYRWKFQNAGKKTYSCSICGAEFSLLTFLLYHRRSHIMSKKTWNEKGVGYAPTSSTKSPRKYNCSVCGRDVRDKTCLERHMRTHTGERPFSCSKCGKSFRLKGTMQVHMKIHTKVDIPQPSVTDSLHSDTSGKLLKDTNKSKSTDFKCYTCDEQFCNQEILTLHVRTHLEPSQKASDKPTGQDLVSKSGDYKQRVRKYVCSICGKGCRDSTDLKEHSTKHTNERPHACPHCEKCFKRRSTLGAHMVNVHGIKLSPIPRSVNLSQSCEKCGKLFKCKSRLERHQKIHGKETSCDRCGKRFRKKYHLEQHKAKSITDKCPKCEKLFCNRELYSCHIGMHYRGVIDDNGMPNEHDLVSKLEGFENDMQKCVSSTCGKGFRRLTDLVEHEKNRTDDGPYPCPKCGKLFCSAATMESHLKIHSKQFGIKKQSAATTSPTCHICGKAFMSVYSLRLHRKIHNRKLTYKHLCDLCGIKFRDKCDLDRHKKHRTGESGIKCLKCGELFCNEKMLAWHLKTHRLEEKGVDGQARKPEFAERKLKDPKKPDKKCVCSICGWSFRDLTDLKRHGIIHKPSDQRPYSCRICCKYFRLKLTKEAHMRSAHAPRIETAPEPCGICGQFFKSLTSLRIHLRLHNGRPKRAHSYACEKCGKKFRDKCDFKRHTKSSAGENPVKCPKCDEIFCNRKLLDSHLIKNHYQIIISGDDKPYKCSECEKCFKELRFLNRHVIGQHIGRGRKRHACTKCTKTFRDKCTLIQHLGTHAIVRPYSCYKCGASFNSKSTLTQHFKDHACKSSYSVRTVGSSFMTTDKTDLT